MAESTTNDFSNGSKFQSLTDHSTEPTPSDPVAETINTIVELHQRAERRVDTHQKYVEHGTALIGRPTVLYILIGLIIFWMALNALAPSLHMHRVDPPPFYWLQGACSMGGLLIAMIVLITQNRQGRLNERRAQLDLQISMLNEQKATKIIQLIEELRRDMPLVHDRRDPEAEIMTQTLDARAMIEALEVRMEADELLAEQEAESGSVG